jgi:hypothetical protein
MANRPANAGAHSAGPQQRPQRRTQRRTPQGTQQGLPPGPDAAPPPVHHQDYPRSRRAAAAKAAKAARPAPAAQIVAWLPYLIVLAGTGAGLFVASQGSRNAGRGAAVVGAALLVAALARLALPPRYAGLLVSRSKAQDVAAFAVLGAAVLGVAASL